MSYLSYTLTIFAIVWLITFFPAWWLLIKILALSVSAGKLSFKFWFYLLIYRLLIAAPYLVLLVMGQGVLPKVVEIIVYGFIISGIIFSLIRFIFANKITNTLWWIYGFVYDGLLHYAPYRRLIQSVINRCVAEKPSVHSVLELGCGTGNVLKELGGVYPLADIVGVDSSSSMVQIARTKCRTVHVVEEDIISFLKRQNKTYDLIVLQNVLYAIDERKVLWQLLSRRLNNDGVIVITNSDKAGSFSITKEHIRYGKLYELFHPKLIAVGVIDAFISQLSRTGSFNFLSKNQILSEASGYFKMSSVRRVYGEVNILFTLRKREA